MLILLYPNSYIFVTYARLHTLNGGSGGVNNLQIRIKFGDEMGWTDNEMEQILRRMEKEHIYNIYCFSSIIWAHLRQLRVLSKLL